MEESFVELLKLLSDSKPIDPPRLAELSDLGGPELDRFGQVWNALPLDRRRAVLGDLARLADSQIELTFEAINRVALDDPESQVRLLAIKNLWESEDPAIARRFLDCLSDDPSSEVRAAAGKALGVFVLIGETRELSYELLRSIEDALLSAFRADDSERVRDGSLESLGYSSRREVPDLIEAAYQSGGDRTRRSALRAMSHSANRVWREPVLAQLHHPDPSVRLQAVKAAGELGLQDGAEEVADLLEDVDPEIRRAAIWSLGQIGGPLAADTLTALSQDPSDTDEAQLLEDAIDNLAFESGTRELFLLDFDNPHETND